MLKHQAIQRGLLGAVALVVNRGAIRRLVGLRPDGLHALLMSERWCFTVSNRATRRHYPLWRLLAGAHLNVSTVSSTAAEDIWAEPEGGPIGGHVGRLSYKPRRNTARVTSLATDDTGLAR